MPQTILIFLFGDIGDTLLTVPAIRALRECHPGGRLVLLAKQTPASLVGGLDLVDDVIVFDKHLFDRPIGLLHPSALLEALRTVREVRAQKPDVAVLFHHLVSHWGALKFAVLAVASGARERVGVDNGRGWFLTRRIPDRGFGARHEAEYWMEVAGLLGASGNGTPESPITPEDRRSVAALLTQSGLDNSRLLAIHPGTGSYGPGRRWPAASFAEAAQALMDSEGLMPIVVGTREDSTEVAEVMSPLDGQALDLCGRTSVGELGALLERCELLIANDGGVAHIGAAVGAPTLVVFGPSNDRAWAPPGSVVIAADLPCRPCFYRDFSTGLRAGCATRECLHLVSPEAVVRTARTMLREEPVAV